MSVRVVDFVGVTLSARAGLPHARSSSQPVAVAADTPLRLDEELASSLPCVKQLMDAGVTFTVFHGCPMLRATNVPQGPKIDELLKGVTGEFGSRSMMRAVRRTIVGNGNADKGVDDSDDDSDFDAGEYSLAPGLWPNAAQQRDWNDVALSETDPERDVEHVLEQDVSDSAECAPAEKDAVAAALSEWSDLPLCALRIDSAVAGAEVATGERWRSSTGMAVDFMPVDNLVTFECGKRLNRTVMEGLAHIGLTDRCVSLFTTPETVIRVPLLRAFQKQYQELFASADSFFKCTKRKECFRAHRRGVYVFGLDAEIVQRALVVAQNVVTVALSQWQFVVERPSLKPLSRDDVSLSLSSPATLAQALAMKPVALSLGVGGARFDLAQLKSLLMGASQLRMLTLAGCDDVPVELIDNVMRHNRELVVCWVSEPARVELARAHASRVSLLAGGRTDAANVLAMYVAKSCDEELARTLVGTYFAIMSRDSSTLANIRIMGPNGEFSSNEYYS
jgi:hypothetical protein